jgi:glycosyltransferase involved in cell wall biosynthesis
VLWLVHQYRQPYELAGTVYDNRELTELERAARRKLHELDTRFIGECKARFLISETVAERLRRFNNLLSIPLSPPSLLQAKIAPGPYSDTMLCFGRLALNKRTSLMLDAMKLVPEAKVLVCGEGAEERSLRELADRYGLGERCRFAGRVPDEVLIAEFAQSRAVLYAPFDEDYGYATIEAFLAEKPVITCRDSGEAARIVEGTGGGWIVGPSPPAVAAAISAAYRASNAELAALGRAGAAFARELN